MLAITVNDRPIDASAILEHGRVLVPLRAIFTALGGTAISYDAKTRTIAVHLPQRTLVLHDVRAEIVAERAYVPLGFVAQAMDAAVGYDARAQLVTIAAPAQPALQANVTGLSPQPDAAVNSAYPTISASLSGAKAAANEVTLTIDGTDVTQLAAFDGSTITYLPRAGLARGAHTIVFSGRTSAQQPFSAQWSFTTDMAAPPDASAFDPGQFRFYTSGPAIYRPGDLMHFVLVAPPDGTASIRVCGLGEFPMVGSLESELYTTSIPAPPGFWIPSCQVTAVYTSWNGTRTYEPVPVYVGLYTRANPSATPRPHITARPLPKEPRKPEPTPTPHAAPAVHASPVPRPRRTPQA